MGSISGPLLDDADFFGDYLGTDDLAVDEAFVDTLLASLGQPAKMQSQPAREQEPQSNSAELNDSSDRTSSDHAVPAGRPRASKAKQGLVMQTHNDRREKSKLAQRKFRLRQKERAQAKGQELAEATEKLRKVSLEREQLQQQNKMLEVALASATSAEPARSSSDDTILSGDVLSSDMTEEIEPDASLFEPNVLMDDYSNIELRTLNGHVYRLTCTDVKEMTLEDAVRMWEDIVNTSAVLLAKANGNLDSPAGKHMQALVLAMTKLKSCMHLNHWRLKTSMAMLKMGEGSPLLDPTPRDFHWEEIVAAMRLTQKQITQILELRSKYLSKWADMIAARNSLEQELQNLAFSADSSISQTQQQMELHSLAERLARLWQETHIALVPFFRSVCTGVLDALQMATLNVQSYPWMPDTMGLAAYLAQQAGLPKAEDVLATRFPAACMLLPSGKAARQGSL